MEHPTVESSLPTTFRVGEWCVDPASGQVTRNGESVRVEVRTMRLLVSLANRAGEVVGIDELLDQVWPEVTVAPDSVYQAVTSLRRLLGDDPKRPTYIATVPRLGYRMVAKVSAWPGESIVSAASLSETNKEADTLAGPPFPTPGAFSPLSRRSQAVLLSLLALCVGLMVAFLIYGGVRSTQDSTLSAAAAQAHESIAVVPFLDLTEGMQEEEFADGMTEELIDKLSKIPGLRVPGATSSFYFKGKQVTVGDIAKSLGVSYVLDGSVRKSGGRLRVAARLVRAENGYVVWSETYDRPFQDIIMVQDDIAGEVAKALRSSIGANPAR